MSKKENSVGLKRWCRKRVTWIAAWIEVWPERTGIRFIILLGMAWLGLAFGSYIFTCIKHLFPLINGLEHYLKPATVSIPVLTALWYFRTYDTRQKIYQDDLFKGLDNLASNNPVQIDIGVAMLREISKKVPSFNETIKLAFIRRLKSMPIDYKPGNGRFLSYAQHIMRWLIQHKKENKDVDFNLNGLDLSYQEFFPYTDSRKIIFKELFTYDYIEVHLSLYCASTSGIDFTDFLIMDPHETVLPDLVNDSVTIHEALQEEMAKDLLVISIPPPVDEK